MSKLSTSTAALATAAAVGWIFTHNPLGPAVAMAATGLILHAKFSGGAPKDAQFGETVRGTQVDSKTKRKQARVPVDQITLGGILIPRDNEPQHFLVVGNPGVGKTVAWLSVMDVARARHQRAVVYDPTGEFVSHYYRSGQDVILSPIDARSASWSPWGEGQTAFDYENIARALIPDSAGENQFWVDAARGVFQSVLAATTDLSGLIDLVLAQDHEVFQTVIQAQGLIGLCGPPNMLASTRGVAATYVRQLAYLPPFSGRPFSIRDWVHDETKDSWLFVTSREDVRKTIRPLLSLWLGLAVQAVMTLPVNRERRLWLVLDELPYLQKLPAVDTALAGGRKYGAACLVGVQTIPQLREIYGREAAASLMSYPSTRLSMRVGDAETAEFLSKSLGDRHTIRKVSSESQNSGGGGQSTSEQHSIEAAVLPSEILALPDLVGYLRVPNDPIIKKIKLIRRERGSLAEPYQYRSLATPPPIPQALLLAGPAGLARAPVAGPDAPDLDGADLPDS